MMTIIIVLMFFGIASFTIGTLILEDSKTTTDKVLGGFLVTLGFTNLFLIAGLI